MSLDDLLKSIIDNSILQNVNNNDVTNEHVTNSSNAVIAEQVNHCDEFLSSIDVNFGTIQVTQGSVLVKGKRNIDVLAKLTPCQGVTVLINDTEVKETVEVAENDLISIECITDNIPCNIKVEVYESEAYLNIRPGKIIKHTLVEQPEQRHITLQTKSETISIPFAEQEISQCLQQSGVTFGIKYNVLSEIAINQSTGRFLIAAGKKPVPPEDDQVVVLFTEDLSHNRLDDLISNKKIDIHSIKSVPSVDSGTMLAVKKPGKPGTPGIAVTGQPLLPRQPKNIELQAGKGTTLINQGNAIIAAKSGRPYVKRGKCRCLVAIEDCLTIYGDIDISTGNQIFKGSVQIMGNVQDGMKVHAGGRVDIGGYCSRAEIIAMEHIRAKNIISSTVQAGVKSKYFVACKENLRNLKTQLISLINAYTQLTQQMKALQLAKVREGHIILVLIEKCYKDLIKLLKATVQNFNTLPMELPEFTMRLINMIQANLPPLDLTIAKINDFIEAISRTEEFLFSDENIANIYTEEVLTSYLACTGSIYIQGDGCINSQVISGDSILVDGVARGGLLSARSNITAGELGSKFDVPIVVSVTTKEGKITVNQTAHAGVVLKIANFKKTIVDCTGPIIAYANDQGIVLKPLI